MILLNYSEANLIEGVACYCKFVCHCTEMCLGLELAVKYSIKYFLSELLFKQSERGERLLSNGWTVGVHTAQFCNFPKPTNQQPCLLPTATVQVHIGEKKKLYAFPLLLTLSLFAAQI